MSTVVDIQWSEEFATGIDIIDEQHRQLFTYFEEIQTLISTKQTEGLADIVRGLVDYAISHNTFEESLMEKGGYPMLDAHHRVHENFKSRALAYGDRLSAGEDPIRVAREVRVDIGIWLMNHIRREDKHYVPYVRKVLDNQGLVSRLLSKVFG